MSGEYANQKPEQSSTALSQLQRREEILATIALLLGPDTEYAKRARASQHLIKLGPETLPLLLQTLHTYPEITTPEWPWWPPQYEHVSRLLIQMSLNAGLGLGDLLRYPGLSQPPGPVLWISVTEAAGLLSHMELEPLLRESLTAPWWMVRYAAAIALTNRATQVSLSLEARKALYQCQSFDLEFPVRLVAACALLRCADERGLETLLHFLRPEVLTEIRKAALFILATELSLPLTAEYAKALSISLLQSIQDSDPQVALHAARAFKHIENPAILTALEQLLELPYPHTRLAILNAFEELSNQKTMRNALQTCLIPKRIGSLVLTEETEIRKQACYTLATLGGEYTVAFLGTIMLDISHPAYLETIEALRLLPDAQHPPLLKQVLNWLLYAFSNASATAQICALDSLIYLAWQARIKHQHTVISSIKNQLAKSALIAQLLASPSAQIRQRGVESLDLLDSETGKHDAKLLEMLRHDPASGVRASIAVMFGKTVSPRAIPDLIQALSDNDEQVTEAVLNALSVLAPLEEGLIVLAIKEVAGYRLPLQSLKQGQNLARSARAWLKQHKKRSR